MKNNTNYKLYLVTDRNILAEKSLETAVKEAIEGGVTLVQLREKDISSLEFYHTALRLKQITSQYHIPLMINDRLDIALAVDAEGIHLGQKDIPCTVARKLMGKNKIIGVSAATVEEAKKAEEDGADYIGVGALFSTNTKQDTRAVSIELLKEIKNNVSIPVVAIGGINENNVSLLKDTNIDGIAVVSAILGKKDIKSAAQKLLSKI
ncbi:MAG: thiamine phosphate synthase [Epulopiscium sp.]|nr:thiamine phosphate synthase [Candidatus Epulonipiscium sp.]